jgi:cell division protein FtsB
VREALSLALDRDGLIQARELLGGHGLKGLSPIPPGSWAHNDKLPAPVFDPQKAASVLDEAGWVDGDGDEIRDRDGQPLHVTLSVRGDSPLLVDMAAAIQKGWRAIGIQVDVQEIQGANLAATLGTRAFSALLFSIELPYYDPDPYALWHSTQIAAPGQNYAGFNSPEADQLLVDGRRAHPVLGQPERRQLYERFQEIFAEELPALIIAYPAYTYVVADPTIGNVQLPSLVVQPGRRVVWVVGLTLAGVYAVRLANLALEVRTAQQQQARMEREVARLQAQVEALSTAAAEAETDAYVERVAREQLDMARPGDQVFVPVPAPSPLPEPEAAAPPPAPSVWDRLLDWLRGR